MRRRTTGGHRPDGAAPAGPPQEKAGRGPLHTIDLVGPHLVHDVTGPWPTGGSGDSRLLRSGYAVPFDAEDVARLRARGMTAVLDLRSDHEAGKLPQALDSEPGLACRRTPIGDEASRPLPGQCGSLADLYVRHISQNGAALADAVAFVVAPRDGAVLVHCRTGRDRTGLVVALALSLAGWDRESVVAQHAQAAEAVAPFVARRRASWLAKGKDVAFFDTMNTGAVPALHRALDWIADRHGTTADYLADHGASASLPRQASERLGPRPVG